MSDFKELFSVLKKKRLIAGQKTQDLSNAKGVCRLKTS